MMLQWSVSGHVWTQRVTEIIKYQLMPEEKLEQLESSMVYMTACDICCHSEFDILIQ